MKAFNRKRKPKHSTKTKYCLYEHVWSIPFSDSYIQKHSYSKKRSCIDIVDRMFQCNNVHFCIERYTPKIVLI